MINYVSLSHLIYTYTIKSQKKLRLEFNPISLYCLLKRRIPPYEEEYVLL